MLLGLLARCGPMTDVPLDASTSVTAATSRPAVATSSPVASVAPSTTATSEAPSPGLSAEQIHSLTEQLRGRRVFRHLLLGNMPAERERHSWLLSKDGKQLTLTCEQGDPARVESGRPDPMRWFLVASASFVATDLSPGGTWAPHYRREQVAALPRRSPTVCAGVGEQLALTCRVAKLQVFGANAFVPVETRSEAPIRWHPSARRAVTGLSCEATARDFELTFYDFPKGTPRPMLFFSDAGPAVERIVYSDAVQYADFREATLAPFDGLLPPHLRNPAP